MFDVLGFLGGSKIVAFLGSSIFRMIWGELSSWWTKRQDHQYEMERLKQQSELEDSQHKRSLEMLKMQSELGIKTIEAKSDATLTEIEATGWLEGVKGANNKTGNIFFDCWNASIRPCLATWAIIMITLAEFNVFTISEFATSISSAALGLFLAERNLLKRGKN